MMSRILPGILLALSALPLFWGCKSTPEATGTGETPLGGSPGDGDGDNVGDGDGELIIGDGDGDGDGDGAATGGTGPVLTGCGDGYVEKDEECDDANDEEGDGCSSNCEVEDGFNCPVAGSACEECGNGTKESTEECDDGNKESGDGCTSSCKVEGDYECIPGQ